MGDPNKKIRYAGDVIIDELTIITRNNEQYDLTQVFSEINLYEDMYSGYMCGNVLLTDGVGLAENLPILGEELLRVRISTPGFPDEDEIYMTFKVYAITDKEPVMTDRIQAYTLHFISQEGFLDSMFCVPETFRGTGSKIVENIFNKYIKLPRNITAEGIESNNYSELTILEETKNNIVFTSPNWSPLRCMNYVASRSLRKDNDGSNFVFFQSNKGFYFGSVQQLIDMQAKQKFVFDRYTYSPNNLLVPNINYNNTYKKPTLDRSYGNVESFNIGEDFNLLKSNERGHLANRIISFDIINKKITTTNYDHLADWKKYVHVDYNSENKSGEPPVSDRQLRASKTFTTVYPKHPYLYDGVKDNSNELIEKIIPTRMSLMADMDVRKINIVVPGRTDIEVGMLVEFVLPSFISKDKEMTEIESADKYYSGVYLITAIRHSISPAKHRMRLELSKDSVNTKVNITL